MVFSSLCFIFTAFRIGLNNLLLLLPLEPSRASPFRLRLQRILQYGTFLNVDLSNQNLYFLSNVIGFLVNWKTHLRNHGFCPIPVRRPLKKNCGHLCLLLFHPGPCPSCPMLVKSRCFCGSIQDVRRCGFKKYLCYKQCNKMLDCGIHRCAKICHNGECPPCTEKGIYRCQCGKVKEDRECCDRKF